jgi:hypothetical protein
LETEIKGEKMDHKLKSKGFITLLIILAFLSSQSLVADTKIKKKVFKQNKDFGTEMLNLKIDEKTMYVLPRPMVIFKLLADSKLKLEFVGEINTQSRYLSESKKALNLGARCADGIAMMYGTPSKSQQRDLGTTIMRLSKSLDLTQGLESEIQELQTSLKRGDRKVTEKKIDDIFSSTEILFNQRQDQHLAVFVSLGGWVEALYISTSSLMSNYNADSSKVLSQGNVIDVYIDSLKSRQELVDNQPALTKIASQLPKIKDLVATDKDAPISAQSINQLHQIAKELKKAIESM